MTAPPPRVRYNELVMAKEKGNGNGASTDVTVQVLTEIRDEIRSTNRRLDDTRTELSTRIQETNKLIDETNKHLVETEIRLATAIGDLRGSVVEVRDLLKEQLDLRKRVERIEQHLGLPPNRAA